MNKVLVQVHHSNVMNITSLLWWSVISHHISCDITHHLAVETKILLSKRRSCCDEIVSRCCSNEDVAAVQSWCITHHTTWRWCDMTSHRCCGVKHHITSPTKMSSHHDITLCWSYHIAMLMLCHIASRWNSAHHIASRWSCQANEITSRCDVLNHITSQCCLVLVQLIIWRCYAIESKWNLTVVSCDITQCITCTALELCDSTSDMCYHITHHLCCAVVQVLWCMHHASRCEEDLAVVPSKCAVLSYAMKLWCACMTKQRCAVPMLMRSSDEVICRCYAGVVLVNEVLCQAKQCCDIFVLLIWSCYAVETLLCRCEALRWRKVMPSKWNDIMLLVSRCYSLAQQHRCASEWCVMLQAKRCYVLC